MWEENKRLNTEILEYRSLSGYLDNNKRLDYSDAGRQQLVNSLLHILCQASHWFSQLLNQFRTGTFRHYRITKKTTGKVYHLISFKFVSAKEKERPMLKVILSPRVVMRRQSKKNIYADT
jgi:hypothetical protein